MTLSFILFVFTAVESLQVNGLSYIDKLSPGDKKQVKITLMNDKEQAETVALKLTDYSCNREGQHFFDPIGTQARSNAEWINFPMSQVTLAPKEHYDLIVTIDVPYNPSSDGSYWSVLLIEPTEPFQTLKESENGFQLFVKVRYAYHFVTTLGNEKTAIKFLSTELKTLNEKKMISIDVENTGKVFINPKLTLKLFNDSGKLEKTIHTQAERIYPGMSSRYLLDADGIEEKKYKAFLLFDNGDNHLWSHTFEITF